MMKKIILGFIIILPFLCKAQPSGANEITAGATVAIAGQAIKQTAEQSVQTGILTTLSTSMVSMDEAEKEYKKLMENATWIKNLKTAKQLIFLVEAVFCTYHDLQANALRTGMFNNCIFSFKYQMSTIYLQSAIDILSVVLTNGKSMTAGERIESLTNAINSFGKAHTSFASLNKQLGTLTNISLIKKRQSESISAIIKLRRY